MNSQIKEREIKGVNGWIMLFVVLAGVIGGIACMAVGFALVGGDEVPERPGFFALAAVGIIIVIVSAISLNGFKVLAPNEGLVLTLFGKYHGTLKRDGFYFINPF